MEGWNYFNYFTEIEEYFWKKRGAHLLVSPLDWAIMETWQKAGVPLEAVLTGIDRAFESYGRSRRGAGKLLKSLAYCTDAVLEAAEEKPEAAAGSSPATGRPKTSETFSRDELKTYFARNFERVVKAGEKESAANAELPMRLREIAEALLTCEALLDAPSAIDFEKAEQLAMIEKQYIQKRLLEEFDLPRLSLYYFS